MKRAVAVVDLGAVRDNARRLEHELRSGTRLCAVVKADGYGHGMVQCARAAMDGGARMLAVATGEEARELRASLADVPLLVMGALSPEELEPALDAGAELALWRAGFLDAIALSADERGIRPRLHVKFDTGMGRLGERDADRVLALCERVASDRRVELAGVWTHFATADEPGDDYFGAQLERFTALVERVRASHEGLVFHAANSAATLREPDSHFDMVRCGIAIYGLDPFGADPAARELRPALELRSYVADVKAFEAGASAGYGRRWKAERDTRVAILPIGYGDGWRRGLTNSAEVLIGDSRYPLVGTVSMDNITADVGPGTAVEPGAQAVLIGGNGSDRILAEDLARALGTINYEITCGISPRVPREYIE